MNVRVTEATQTLVQVGVTVHLHVQMQVNALQKGLHARIDRLQMHLAC